MFSITPYRASGKEQDGSRLERLKIVCDAGFVGDERKTKAGIEFPAAPSPTDMRAARTQRPPVRSSPVGQGHALEQLGQRSVDGQMRRAVRPKAVSLTRLLVDGVEIVAFLGRVLSVRRRHHEMPAVDDLKLVRLLQIRLVRVRVVVGLLLDDHRRPGRAQQELVFGHPGALVDPAAAAVAAARARGGEQVATLSPQPHSPSCLQSAACGDIMAGRRTEGGGRPSGPITSSALLKAHGNRPAAARHWTQHRQRPQGVPALAAVAKIFSSGCTNEQFSTRFFLSVSQRQKHSDYIF